MPSEIRLLLDEHYPSWLASLLTEAGLDTEAVIDRDDLRAADDSTVLRTATVESRLVVTEDVSTFAFAMAAVPEHAGVIFCHHARFPRTRPGLERLRRALIALGDSPPDGFGQPSFVWWLSDQ
ncbi:DUF5615 family PIN-like protein [Pseudactinotalea sp.]|uniref:DUF5615 family PIN-like protein n=1 Tax=Pseudactinotalea sp. TaxID=1926260 RepID=UPI003B3A396A